MAITAPTRGSSLGFCSNDEALRRRCHICVVQFSSPRLLCGFDGGYKAFLLGFLFSVTFVLVSFIAKPEANKWHVHRVTTYHLIRWLQTALFGGGKSTQIFETGIRALAEYTHQGPITELPGLPFPS
ncbi:hypothetical protein BZA77DRAFT_294718 [Pyronema omphalodes]|nr:hypothetical protein BZA77DRAFT_294718 [Pyronema omphalodes]